MPGLAIYRLAATAHTNAWFTQASALCETSYADKPVLRCMLDLELTQGSILRPSSN